MSRDDAQRPGLIIFVGGVVCLILSVALSYYLSHEASARLVQLEPSDYVVKDRGKSVEYTTFRALLFGMNALM